MAGTRGGAMKYGKRSGRAQAAMHTFTRDYGLTLGISTSEKIALTDLGRDIVYAPNADVEKTLKLRAFLNVEIFKRVA